MAKREDRVLFAGEHTHYPHAWLDTAIKTALRAAAELHEGSDWTEKTGYKYNKTPRKKPLPKADVDGHDEGGEAKSKAMYRIL